MIIALLICGCGTSSDSSIVLEIDGIPQPLKLDYSEPQIADMLAKSEWSNVRLIANDNNLDCDLQYHYRYTPGDRFPNALYLRDQLIMAIPSRDGISDELAKQIFQNLHLEN